jgi:hypothetical protein
MLHLFFLFSLQLYRVALTLGCVRPFSTRHDLVVAYEYRMEFAQRETHLDVESRRINLIPNRIDDWLWCLSRDSEDTRSTFFDVETKSSIASKPSIRFSIWERHRIQHVRLPVPHLKPVDSNDRIDQSVSLVKPEESVCHCLDSELVFASDWMDRNTGNPLYVDTSSDASRWDIERYPDEKREDYSWRDQWRFLWKTDTCDSKSSISRERSVRFVIGKRHQIQRVR